MLPSALVLQKNTTLGCIFFEGNFINKALGCIFFESSFINKALGCIYEIKISLKCGFKLVRPVENRKNSFFLSKNKALGSIFEKEIFKNTALGWIFCRKQTVSPVKTCPDDYLEVIPKVLLNSRSSDC